MIDNLDLTELDNYSADELASAVKKINKALEKRNEGEVKKLRSQIRSLPSKWAMNG